MKLSWKTELPLLIAIALMFVVAAIAWSSAPEQIPVHWNIHGEVDRNGGKFEGLLGVPLITLGLYLLLTFLPCLDPGYANYERFATAYTVIRYAMVAFMTVIDVTLLLSAFGKPINVGSAISTATGALFVVLGNFMGKIRPNWFVGIRTPWTLSSKESWTKTHRLGGWVFIAAGLTAMILGPFKPNWAVVGMAAVMVPGIAALLVYSYLVWRNDAGRIPPAGTRPDVS